MKNLRSFRWLTFRPIPVLKWTVLIGLVGLVGGELKADMRTCEGTYLRLTSDIADEASLADYVSSFDAAVPQWLAFWGLPIDRVTGWRIDGYLMGDEAAFRASGALPATVPAFRHGFASPETVWVQYQSTAYYNRHLILHEGVHALAIGLFGGGGPSWYMEGTAELLATHRDPVETTTNASLPLLAQSVRSFRINDLPRNRQESPMWGRYRVIDEKRQANALPTLASVLKLPMNLEGDVESYTWTWAAALMLTHYPDTRDVFVGAAFNGLDQSPAFTAKFAREIQNRWPVLRARWQLWLNDMEYGFDPRISLVGLSVDDPRYDGSPLDLRIDANYGWQSAGVWFPDQSTIRVRADGRCRIVAQSSLKTAGSDRPDGNDTPELPPQVRDWISEPAGITAKYHRGHPIGQLQVCVLPIPNQDDRVVNALDVRPWVGPVMTIPVNRPSWLLFRVNDVPGTNGVYQRGDNGGAYQVMLQ
ncbi:hypothetical protein [Neorhodopirellula pilleata]|uniref:DUF1570 domain-containing protein n=1 Tax=Neorhodopirellula pilleata TaxID=2714738 RepID=A0A5C6ATJ0_9BACT|nr:hypothetical protein [Neorhodopirellula pilleata]TWU03315.1 hypothetical protein Pla100_02330 [Neorhodopirellula pilleata]